jgi:hypothetical protein
MYQCEAGLERAFGKVFLRDYDTCPGSRNPEKSHLESTGYGIISKKVETGFPKRSCSSKDKIMMRFCGNAS